MHACYMHHPSRPPSVDHPNSISWMTQSQIPTNTKVATLASDTFTACSSFVRNKVSHSHVVLTFYCLHLHKLINKPTLRNWVKPWSTSIQRNSPVWSYTGGLIPGARPQVPQRWAPQCGSYMFELPSWVVREHGVSAAMALVPLYQL